jgi:hypothetical protein
MSASGTTRTFEDVRAMSVIEGISEVKYSRRVFRMLAWRGQLGGVSPVLPAKRVAERPPNRPYARPASDRYAVMQGASCRNGTKNDVNWACTLKFERPC